MKETRFFYVPDAASRTELPADECQHAVRVLRLKEGDELFLMDGVGCYYRAEVTSTASHHCGYTILDVLPQERQWEGTVHLAIAPTKMMDRMEWMLEKVTEVGIDRLSLLDCQFSERHIVKLPRLEKIAISAVKQSRKAWIPQLEGMVPFQTFIRQHREGRRYIAHCYDEIPRTYLFDALGQKPLATHGTEESTTSADTSDAIVMIGPEGDFSIEEVRQAVSQGWQSVHLGKSRLRTETAGLAAVMMMQMAGKR